jgi:hypothetical protein
VTLSEDSPEPSGQPTTDHEIDLFRDALTRYLCGGERSREDVRRLEGFLSPRLIEMPIFSGLADDLSQRTSAFSETTSNFMGPEAALTR